MKLLTGLFMAAKRRLMTHDGDACAFKGKLDDLVNRKDELNPESIAQAVEELKKLTADIPDSEDMAKLLRFIEDFKAVKEQTPEVAKEAAEAVAKQYETRCNAALQDAPDVAGAASGNDAGAAGAAVEATKAPDGEGKPTDADLASGVEAAGKAAGDALGTATKIATADGDFELSPETLEAIYQYCKKRIAEDAASGTADADKQEPEKEDGANGGDKGSDGGDDKGGAVWMDGTYGGKRKGSRYR